jgi:hypothetical protein
MKSIKGLHRDYTRTTLTAYGDGNGAFDYCLENPTGSVSSVRASRANWCPGDITPAIVIDAAALSTPGPHAFEWNIDGIAEGGSWKVSATYFAFATR